MPMYEFYCSWCNTIYTFFSRTINTDKVPLCPKCHTNDLKRMISRFAVTAKSKSSGDDSGMPDLPIDEAKMERAIESLASEAENINEDDPRQAADLMRKLSNMTGLKLGDKMEEALSRIESGEDPEAVGQEMEDLDENDLFKVDGGGKGSSRRAAPTRDETIYDM